MGRVVVGAGFGGAFVLEGSAEVGGAEGVGSRGTDEAGARFFEMGSRSSSPPANSRPVDRPAPARRSATLTVIRVGTRFRKVSRNAPDGVG
ncbi:hypothetical protein G4Z16_22620 [Streptomyces bathyalis]|uniref:Uncharacterized protein n=1 Tax=Streptomyces bathyalis TaxID=2710756 RepID=A0A7T1T999_9ACTN|nr:hypothetical protein [Streptomyces bathyalis]QPP08734.1 hypothetical protein G4Z16_22620 [Streptomyces bathyalis]